MYHFTIFEEVEFQILGQKSCANKEGFRKFSHIWC